MKDLKGFLEAICDDKKLAEKVKGAKNVKEMVKIANEAGYSVSEDEMNDFLMQAVAGGGILGTIGTVAKKADDFLGSDTGKKVTSFLGF